MDNYILLKLYKAYQIYLYLYSLWGQGSRRRFNSKPYEGDSFFVDEHSNMRAWLYMVARNLYFNHRKQESRNMPLDEIEASIHDNSSMKC